MAKGMPRHTGDPNIKTGQQGQFADEDIYVNDIMKFISTDPGGNPCFVEQNGKPIVRFAFTKSDGTEGPPCSATVSEFWGIVRALGVNVDSVDARTRHTSEALLRGKQLVNERITKSSIKVKPKNGWVNGNRIEAAAPPEGKYTVQFVSAHRFDYAPDDYHFSEFTKNGKNSRVLIFEFEIISNGFGKPTLWDGAHIAQWMEDPFVDATIDTNGRHIQAVKEGYPLFGRDPNTKAVIPQASKWETFAKYFAPSLAEHEWMVNEKDSPYGVCEVLEPQYIFIHCALADKRKVVVNYRLHPLGKKPNISWRDVSFDNELPTAEPIQIEEATQPVVLNDLVTFIQKTWPDRTIFAQTPNGSNELLFTDDGKKWAGEFMGGENGPWVRAGLSLENRKHLHELSVQELIKLYGEFQAQYGESEEPDW